MFINEHGIFICIAHINDDGNNNKKSVRRRRHNAPMRTFNLFSARSVELYTYVPSMTLCAVGAPRHRYCAKHSRCIFVVVHVCEPCVPGASPEPAMRFVCVYFIKNAYYYNPVYLVPLHRFIVSYILI